MLAASRARSDAKLKRRLAEEQRSAAMDRRRR